MPKLPPPSRFPVELQNAIYAAMRQEQPARYRQLTEKGTRDYLNTMLWRFRRAVEQHPGDQLAKICDGWAFSLLVPKGQAGIPWAWIEARRIGHQDPILSALARALDGGLTTPREGR